MKRILIGLLALVLPGITVLTMGAPALAVVDDCGCDCGPCQCRWTGGGSFFTADGMRVTHGFELYCGPDLGPNNLEINWDGNRFHLTELLWNATFPDDDFYATGCDDFEPLPPDPPRAPCNAIQVTGIGRYNGVDGAMIHVWFTDQGEPGTGDWVEQLEIWDADDNLVLEVDGPAYLDHGNHQAHRLTGAKAQ